MEVKSEEYANYLKERPFFSKVFRKIFFLTLAKEFCGTVLDVGCGIGGFLEIYKPSIGIEINRYLIEHLKKKGFKVYRASVYSLPFNDCSFDGVLLSHVLEHLEDPKKAIEEIRRVLKVGGTLVVVVPNKKGFSMDETHTKFWDERELRTFLRKNGFEVVKSYWFPVPIRSLKEIFWFNELRIKAIKK